MKFYFLYVALFFLGFNQNQDTCTIEIEKEQLLESQIILSCSKINNGIAFTIEGFRVKFPGHEAVGIENGGLNSKAKSYLNSMTKGDTVTIFDIKKAKNQSGEILSNVPTITIRFKE